MVVQSLWKNLKSLMAIDLQLEAAEKELSFAQDRIDSEQHKIPHLEEQLKAKHREEVLAQKAVDFAELRAQELKDLEIKKRSDLDRVKNQKEYEAISRELEKVVDERSELEETLMSTWHQLDLSKKELETFAKEVEAKKHQLQETVATQKTALQTLINNLEELKKQRATITPNVPAEWLEQYNQMRTQVPDPIVPLVDSTCSSCFYPVLRQDLMRLQKNAVLPCRGCYRLLYSEKQEDPAPVN